MALALITLNQTLYEQYQANVVCFDNVSEDSSWLQDFADAIRATANDEWDNVMVNNWTLDNITVSFIEDDHITFTVDVDFTEGDLVGNVLTDGLPPSTCLLISTSYVGAAPNRGRIYFSGFGETSQTDGTWDASARQGMKAMIDNWISGFEIQGVNTSLQILRRPSAVFEEYVANPAQLSVGIGSTRSQRRRNHD